MEQVLNAYEVASGSSSRPEGRHKARRASFRFQCLSRPLGSAGRGRGYGKSGLLHIEEFGFQPEEYMRYFED